MWWCVFYLNVAFTCAMMREYYIAAKEIYWDYAPSGRNLIKNISISDDEQARLTLQRGPERIGRIYKKAVYIQYTDGSFTQEIPKDPWLGYLGPTIKAEVHDVIAVYFKNLASRPYSMHPHGVFYSKASEGANYPDGQEFGSKGEFVLPGQTHTYHWMVRDETSPGSDDPNCFTWIYHSHVNEPKDVNSGLIGALLTCRKGILLLGTAERQDVGEDFILMFTIVDENNSWYLEDNIRETIADPRSLDRSDPHFQRSNFKSNINGYMYGNLPGLNMCSEVNVSWHLFGLGSEVDIHTAHFRGQALTSKHHRVDTVGLFPATFVTALMVPTNPGRWLLACDVNEHFEGGMQAAFNVLECEGTNQSVWHSEGKERTFFIAAEEVDWDYGPSGVNNATGEDLTQPGSDSEKYFTKGPSRIGGVYRKILYTEYTDANFTTRRQRTPKQSHMGMLGPVLRAEVGDEIVVTFKNLGSRGYNIHPHGVFASNEHVAKGSYELHKVAAVPAGGMHTYRWAVPQGAGPTQADEPCITYLYTSSVNHVRDGHSGLVGPLLICRNGSLDQHGDQSGTDEEVFLLFDVVDEGLSWYLQWNKQQNNVTAPDDDPSFREANLRHTINGFMFGNLPGLEVCVGKRVSWHVLAVGSQADLHTAYFTGQTLLFDLRRVDTIALFPHLSYTALMLTDTTGGFELMCRTNEHFNEGMRAKFRVSECGMPPGPVFVPQKERTYYLAIREEVWDYAPNRSWEMKVHNTTNPALSPANKFLGSGETRIGSRYKKVRFVEYTDDSFKNPKVRTAEEEHLAALGPLLKGQVGELLVVVLWNTASRPYSIHSHGVISDVPGGLPLKPGARKAYRWQIPERSGPSQADTNCITWIYYSAVDFVRDPNSGLVGPLVVCRSGLLDDSGRRDDVAHEFALLFMVYNENLSWYLRDNIDNFTGNPGAVDVTDEDFRESNLMHSINGMTFGNLNGLNMGLKERVDWYLMGLGGELDMHTIHFHGQTFRYKVAGKDTVSDVYDVFAGTFVTVEMTTDNPGTWLLHCHVHDHIEAGMVAFFQIKTKPLVTANPTEKTAIGQHSSASSHTGLYSLALSQLCVKLLVACHLLHIYVHETS
ncbi:ferroxidase HEPHL1-like [Lethenteron reissneri]|uniref:ferroxidase HEPHL1-like n=1 Tax=Lethenteron reissneri TaxID=7753 RepID=UPI002AB7143F|nr:ferroxidase HEPHL1-like [Lethenteron reissneri]